MSTPLCADLTLKDVIEIGVNGQCLYVNLAASGYDKLNSTGFFSPRRSGSSTRWSTPSPRCTTPARSSSCWKGRPSPDQVGNLALSNR